MKPLKPLKLLLITLTLCIALVFTTGCNSEEATEEQLIETATAEIGDLSLDVSAVGNLAFSEKNTLNFELAGTVSSIFMEEGDYVEEGQVLAKLDTSEKDEYLKTITRTIEQKDQALLQAEINLQNAEDSIVQTNSQMYVDQKSAQARLDVVNAEIALANAENAYEIAENRYNLNYTVPQWARDYEQKKEQLEIANLNLQEAEISLNSVLSDIDLEREIKEKELVLIQRQFDDAQTEYDDAVMELKDAKIQSYEIAAPFDGYITKVNITEGQQIQKNASAIEIANPNEFEADVLVSEIDIYNVLVGSTATVQVDAMQSIVLSAEVIRISPTASIQSGVVNYSVKVKLLSTNTTRAGFAQIDENAFKEASEAIASGELPEQLKEAVEAGQMTQEQADNMIERMNSGNLVGRGAFGDLSDSSNGTMMEEIPMIFEGEGQDVVPFTGDKESSGMLWADAGSSQLPTVTSDSNFSLREGLTVTVSIITETRNNVLLIPSGAVSNRAGQSFVTIVNTDGTEEERVVVTGLSDWQNTEIISGLSEGEKVTFLVTSSSSSEFNMPQGGVFYQTRTGGGMIK